MLTPACLLWLLRQRPNFTSTYRLVNTRIAQCLNCVLNVKALVGTFNQETFNRDYEPSCGNSFAALVPTCSHFTFRTLSDFATSVYLIVTFSISANTQHTMTFGSIWHRNFISYTLYLFANSARNCATRKRDQSWPIYYRISNKLLDAKHDLEVESRISNNKLFQSFHDALIRKWTSYTFLNISSSVNIMPVRILLRAPRV